VITYVITYVINFSAGYNPGSFYLVYMPLGGCETNNACPQLAILWKKYKIAILEDKQIQQNALQRLFSQINPAQTIASRYVESITIPLSVISWS